MPSLVEPLSREQLHGVVTDSLVMTTRAVAALDDSDGTTAAPSGPGSEPARADPGSLIAEKVVGEAILLLRITKAIAEPRLWQALLDAVTPLARPAELAARLCLGPEQALEHAFAHIQLGALGDSDRAIDDLLDLALDEPPCGPDPYVVPQLQRLWLQGLRAGRPLPQHEVLIARSSLGHPVDVLRCSMQEVYDLTHAVMHGTDLGAWGVALPRRDEELVSDLDALVGVALDAENLDLTAELLWSWPMLRLPWTPAAHFAFEMLAAVRGEWGFLPGPGFDAARHADAQHVLRTSYHADLVFGMLCAAILAGPLARSVGVPAAPGCGARMLGRLDPQPRRWLRAAHDLPAAEADTLAPMMLVVALRRASDQASLNHTRQLLQLAVDVDLAEGRAVRQATALLRRGTALAGHASRA